MFLSHTSTTVEEAGGKCLPCVVDVRDENNVRQAVQETVKKFGGIDILVNNTSAINYGGTLDVPMKRWVCLRGS